MWLGLMLVAVVVFVVIAGVLSGGIFTIIMVPVALIAAAGAVIALMVARASGVEVTKRGGGGQPIGKNVQSEDAAHGRATAEELVRARQLEQ